MKLKNDLNSENAECVLSEIKNEFFQPVQESFLMDSCF